MPRSEKSYTYLVSRVFISILTNQDKSCVTILCPIISLVTLKFVQELIAFFRRTGYLLQVESIKKSTVISSLLFITNTLYSGCALKYNMCLINNVL